MTSNDEKNVKGNFEDSHLLKALRYCKGITSNSMISFVVSKYEDIEMTCSELENEARKIKKDWDEFLIYCDPMEEKHDNDSLDYMYATKSVLESADFLKKIKFQDADKELMGLIVYYGYIDDGGGKKAFHTFPCPKGCYNNSRYMRGQRFDLSILNENPWFTDEFNLIK